MEQLTPLERACKAAGSLAKLAERLEVSPQVVWNWKVRGVPIEKCLQIERATQGAVTRRDLRPDDWRDIWPELATVGRRKAA